MYNAHFGFDEAPFGLTPDTAFAFSTRAHQEALNTLLLAVQGGEGFVKITGEVGCGKTLLCRRFLATLAADAGPAVVSCYLPNPCMAPRTLLLALAAELGCSLPATDGEFGLLRQIEAALLARARAGQRVVVCLDEAQALPLASLETLRLLSNLETEKRKLLQVVLFGQPELDATLALTCLRQLRQRIAFHDTLGAMQRDELALYLAHRLRVAGHRSGELFTPAAVAALQRASRGTPRLVNILAHKALLLLYGDGGARVQAQHVRVAARDTAATARRFGWWPTWNLR